MSLQKHLIHLIPIGLFFILTLVLFKPYFTEGKSIYQHDILMAQGGNHQLQAHKSETGEEALWMNNMFSGMPAYLNGVDFPGNWLSYPYALLRLGLPHPISLVFVACVCFYLMLLAFDIKPLLAMAGSVLYGLNGFHIISIGAGHNAKIAAVALIPLVIAGIHLTYKKKYLLGASLTALGLGIQIQANHPQITYYLLLILLVYGIYRLVEAARTKDWRPFFLASALSLVAGLLGVVANGGKLYHIYEYGKYSIRGGQVLTNESSEGTGLDYDYAFRYSNGIFEPMVMFYPNILGGSSQQELSDKSNSAKALMSQGNFTRLQAKEQVKAMPTYWGDQPLTAPYYGGSILLFFVVLSLWILPGRQKYWLLVVAALGIVLSWGKNFPGLNNILFDHLPGYNKFRSVTFTIILPLIAFNLLAILGINAWLQADKEQQVSLLKKSVLVAGGFSLALILFAGAFSYRGAVDELLARQYPDWLMEAIRADRKYLLRMDALRGLIFTLLAAGTLYGSRLFLKQGLMPDKATAILITLTTLCSIDVFMLSRRFLEEDNFQKDVSKTYFAPTAADQYLLETARPGERVLNLQNPWNEARTSYHHESIGGYHGAKMRRYQDLIDGYLSAEINLAITNLRAGRADFSQLHVTNMLNTRFLVAGPQKEAVIQNPFANGNAWLVRAVVTTDNPDDSFDLLDSLNLRSVAILNGSKFKAPESRSFDESGSIELTAKGPNRLTYAYKSESPSYAVFSEMYYPHGWKAYVGDNEVPVQQVDYLLRGLELPAGEHQITFEFTPNSYAGWQWPMRLVSIVIFISFIAAIALEIKGGLNQ